jgi:exodeoxyribonuclease VII large subunit
MFSGNRRGLGFQMKEGDNVVVTGKIEVYERDGKYELNARQIELDGEGNLYLKFEALKRELEDMGMFAPEYKKPIPKYAKRIGIVTASTGAAIRDICNIAQRRNPYVQLILCPALVQGEGAAASIVNGIRRLDAMGLDVIIVGRGGGSIEDLWAFNEEIVARAIFESETPIISAVGHETDTTIADFVADLRVPTPSAAAEIAVFDYVQTTVQMSAYESRMLRALDGKVRTDRLKLENLKVRLERISPANKLNEHRRYLVDLDERMRKCMDKLMTDYRHRTALLAGSLEAHSPAKKLSSGYSYVEGADGKAVKDSADVSVGDEVKIHLYRGRLRAKITETEDGR